LFEIGCLLLLTVWSSVFDPDPELIGSGYRKAKIKIKIKKDWKFSLEVLRLFLSLETFKELRRNLRRNIFEFIFNFNIFHFC
jgi:hypothetical protein